MGRHGLRDPRGDPDGLAVVKVVLLRDGREGRGGASMWEAVGMTCSARIVGMRGCLCSYFGKGGD